MVLTGIQKHSHLGPSLVGFFRGFFFTWSSRGVLSWNHKGIMCTFGDSLLVSISVGFIAWRVDEFEVF